MPESDVGQYFGKYFLLKKLAAGGMGEVFLAKQQGPAGFEKILIVKKVLAHLTENKEFVELFLGEARLAARMNHRNIVQVFELGEENGNYFIAMEYVQGKSLRDVVDAALKRKEKIPGELCRSIAEQICDGASYAHNLTDVSGRGLNIIHRDLNPQNVLVSYTGDVKVIDFGIAKSEMSTVKTEAGMIKGKFVYMSPEQSLAKKLDKRSDIFAVGISLYEMLTGINPFAKNNIVLTLEAVQRYDPPPPSEYDPAFAPFDPIIAKSLAKDRDRRYSDAGEMQDDLRRIVLQPAPERLGQFMSRLFRTQLEEEQKMLRDTDSSRVTNGAKAGSGKTPARPAPSPMATMPDLPPQEAARGQPPEGATMMLPNAGRAKPVTPSKAGPPPRAPAPPPKKGGAGDTLLDMGAPLKPAAEAAPDDNPGATMMLKPGQALPTPPVRATAKNPVAHAEEGGGATMLESPPRKKPSAPPPEEGGAARMLDSAPARPKKAAGNGRGGGGSTNILTPAESAEAQREALEKLKQAQAGVVKTRPRPQPNQAPPAKQKAAGLWIALGVGALVVVAAIGALLFMLLGDDKPAPRPRRGATAVTAPAEPAVEEKAPEEKRVAEPKPDEKKAEAAAPKKPGRKEDAPAEEAQHLDAPKSKPVKPAQDAAPAEKAPPVQRVAKAEKPAAAAAQASAGKMLGTLTVNPGPNVPLAFGGQSFGKVVGARRLPVTSENGTLEVGDGSTPFRISIEFQRSGPALSLKVKSDPRSIVSFDKISKGKSPVGDLKLDDHLIVLELKKPGEETGMAVRLRYTGN